MPLKLKGKLTPGAPDRRYYMIRVQVDGRREVLSSGTRDRSLAERKEQAVVEAMRADPNITKAELTALVRGENSLRHRAASRAAKELTIAEGFARCWADRDVWKHIKATQTYRTNTQVCLDFFGDGFPVRAISRDKLKAFVEWQYEKDWAPSTINRRLACVGRMMREALDWPDGITAAPKVPYQSERGRNRKFILSFEQEEMLFKSILGLDLLPEGSKGGHPRKRDAHFYIPLYEVLVESGMRLGEALNLRREDLDFSTRTEDDDSAPFGFIRLWRAEELKNGKTRTVPMTEKCRATLEKLRSRPEGPFKGLKKRRAQELWDRGRKAAGITDPECVIHGMRHTCATRLLRSLGNIKLVQEWLGHTSVTTTATIYAHIETAALSDAAAVLNRLRRGTKQESNQSSKDING